MKLLALSLGLNPGISVVDTDPHRLLRLGVIRTPARLALNKRLERIVYKLTSAVERWKPNMLVYASPRPDAVLGAVVAVAGTQQLPAVEIELGDVKAALGGARAMAIGPVLAELQRLYRDDPAYQLMVATTARSRQHHALTALAVAIAMAESKTPLFPVMDRH